MGESKKDAAVISLIEAGSEITGGVAGAAIGLMVAGPPGAVAGAAAGPVVKRLFRKLGVEIKKRVLGDREEVRIGATYALALKSIHKRIEEGDIPRQDGFFEPTEGTRPVAEEALEGILLAAQREHEERKLPYYSNLLSSLVFDGQVDRNAANVLLRIGQQLTYRQLCLISLFSRREEFQLYVKLPPRKPDPGERLITFRDPLLAPHMLRLSLEERKADLAQELRELELQGLFDCEGRYGDFLGSYDHIKVKRLGSMLYRLMRLAEVPNSDIQDIIEPLQIPAE